MQGRFVDGCFSGLEWNLEKEKGFGGKKEGIGERNHVSVKRKVRCYSSSLTMCCCWVDGAGEVDIAVAGVVNGKRGCCCHLV